MRKVNSPKCVECNCVEDVYHMIEECAQVEAERSQLFMQFPTLECDAVGVYNNALPHPHRTRLKRYIDE